MEHDGTLHLVDAADRIALFVGLRITAADEHHTYRGTLVELHFATVEVAGCHALEEVDDVALQAEHHTLCLRVAHATVVLDDHRVAAYVDESEEDEALVVDAFGGEPLYCGPDDAVFHLLHPFRGGEGHRSHATHTTGVQAGVVLADALVILCLGQKLVVTPVGKDEHRALDAGEELLDDHTGRGVAEHSAEHLTQLALRFVEGGEDEHALAGTQSVGLQHIGRLQGLKEGEASVECRAVEGLVTCGGDAMALHERLGEVFAALQASATGRGAYHGDGSGAGVVGKRIVDAVDERVFGTHHHHVDGVVGGEVLQFCEVVDTDGHVLTHMACSGISGSDVEFLTTWTLGDFPCQRMFAPAAS